jgi:hypothetical protein
MRHLGAVQRSHRFIKRLFEPSSSAQFAKSVRGMMISKIHIFLGYYGQNPLFLERKPLVFRPQKRWWLSDLFRAFRLHIS